MSHELTNRIVRIKHSAAEGHLRGSKVQKHLGGHKTAFNFGLLRITFRTKISGFGYIL